MLLYVSYWNTGVLPFEDTCVIYYLCVQGRAYHSPSEGLMTKSELQQLAREQFQMELMSYVQVKTIEKRTEPSDIILYYVRDIRQLISLFLVESSQVLGEASTEEWVDAGWLSLLRASEMCRALEDQ